MDPLFPPLVIPAPILLLYLNVIMQGYNPFPQKYVHLFQGRFVFSLDTVLADVQEADYDGYAYRTDFQYGAAFYTKDRAVVMTTKEFVFPCTGGMTPNVVGGWYLTDAGITGLTWGQSFAELVGVSKAGDAVTCQPYFRWPTG